MLCHHIPSCHTMPYHATPNHTIPPHLPHHTMLHLITPHHTTPHHIILCHVTLHHTTSYHTTPRSPHHTHSTSHHLNHFTLLAPRIRILGATSMPYDFIQTSPDTHHTTPYDMTWLNSFVPSSVPRHLSHNTPCHAVPCNAVPYHTAVPQLPT